MDKHIFGRKIYVRSKFSCVHSPHNLCASTLAHSLEATTIQPITSPITLIGCNAEFTW